jgi:hypothetical protein
MRTIAVLAGLLLAGQAWAQAGGDCPQPPDGDATFRLRFDDRGALVPSCRAVLQDRVAPAVRAATDTIVFASGWRGDAAAGSPLDDRFVQELRAAGPAGGAVRAVFIELEWPSSFFPFHTLQPSVARTRPLPATFGEFAAAMQRLYPSLDSGDGARELAQVFELLRAEARGQRVSLKEFNGLAAILKRWDRAGQPPPALGCEARHAEAPGEASIFDLDAGRLGQYLWDTAYLWQGRREGRVAPSVLGPLHIATFWQMRRRAGVIGATGGAELLNALRAAADPAAGPTGLHLVGHSFGAKLLTAALANCVRAQPTAAHSLVLLQGALSQLAFLGEDDVQQVWKEKRPAGVYAALVQQRLVEAPIVVTLSARDVPNAFWYPVGLRAIPGVLEQQSVRSTMYGSLGANGAQRVDAVDLALEPGGRVALRERRIINVRMDKLVGGHDQILAREIYDLVWAAVRWRSRP